MLPSKKSCCNESSIKKAKSINVVASRSSLLPINTLEDNHSGTTSLKNEEDCDTVSSRVSKVLTITKSPSSKSMPIDEGSSEQERMPNKPIRITAKNKKRYFINLHRKDL